MSFRDESEGLRNRIRELEDEVRSLRAERDAATERADRLGSGAAAAAAQKRRDAIAGFLRTLGGLALGAVALGALALGGEAACASCDATVASITGLDPRAAPTAGMLDVDATPDPAAIALVATGDVGTPSNCRGYVPVAPQIVVRSSGSAALRITAEATNGGDLVALLMTPDGQTLCDDDGAGSLNPLVMGVVPAGDTRIWIGTYSSGDTVPFRLFVHADAIAPPVGTSTAGTLSGPGASGAHGVFSGAVTTFTPAASSEPSCRGYLPVDPALTLHLTEPAAVRLDASGPDDLVLFVREPDHHVKCDDDSGPGNAPRIASILPAGDHLVYVGTYSSLGRPASYTLAADLVRVDPYAPATLGARPLGAAGDATAVDGRSAGVVSPIALGATCTGGLVPAAPQVELDVAVAGDLVLALASDGQPFLVVAHEDRTFECLRSGHTRLAVAPGAHRVYVGVVEEGGERDFTLSARLEAPTLRPYTP